MQRNKVLVGVAILMMLLLATLGYWWIAMRPDPQLERVRQMQAEAFRRELSEGQRREKFQQLRKEYDKLSESQRRQLRSERSRSMEGRISQHIREYFELPKSRRVAFLDKQIKEMEKRRRESAKRGREGGRVGRQGFGRGGGNRENSSEQERDARRDRFKRGYLDGTTPQQRAEMAAYMQALRERREELSLPDIGKRRRFHS